MPTANHTANSSKNCQLVVIYSCPSSGPLWPATSSYWGGLPLSARGGVVRPGSAEVLGALSRISARRGDFALARVQLAEALAGAATDESRRGLAAAVHAAAELAESLGQPDCAIEFYGACRRILRREQGTDPKPSRDLADALARLRCEVGDARFEAALSACRAAPFPAGFYLHKVGEWLEGLPSGMGPAMEHPRRAAVGDAELEPGARGTTAHLIERIRVGSKSAIEGLAGRVLDPLRRFGHGRLPGHARGLMDTDDLVQVTVMRGLDRVQEVTPRRKGGFLAYLRQILLNLVRDEVRRSSHRPRTADLDEGVASQAPSPLDEVLGADTYRSYRSALDRLPANQREAVILRVEQGCSYQDIADAIGCTTANAARMMVVRGLTRVNRRLRGN